MKSVEEERCVAMNLPHAGNGDGNTIPISHTGNSNLSASNHQLILSILYVLIL